MQAIAEEAAEHMANPTIANVRRHELVRELRERLDALCHYAECVAGNEGDPDLVRTWRDLEREELRKIKELRELIVRSLDEGVFLDGL